MSDKSNLALRGMWIKWIYVDDGTETVLWGVKQNGSWILVGSCEIYLLAAFAKQISDVYCEPRDLPPIFAHKFGL